MKFPCPQCDFVADNKQKFNQHLFKVHRDPVACEHPGCSKRIKPAYMKAHLKTHDDSGKVECDICHLTMHPASLLRHQQRKHSDVHDLAKILESRLSLEEGVAPLPEESLEPEKSEKAMEPEAAPAVDLLHMPVLDETSEEPKNVIIPEMLASDLLDSSAEDSPWTQGAAGIALPSLPPLNLSETSMEEDSPLPKQPTRRRLVLEDSPPQ